MFYKILNPALWCCSLVSIHVMPCHSRCTFDVLRAWAPMSSCVATMTASLESGAGPGFQILHFPPVAPPRLPLPHTHSWGTGKWRNQSSVMLWASPWGLACPCSGGWVGGLPVLTAWCRTATSPFLIVWPLATYGRLGFFLWKWDRPWLNESLESLSYWI